MIKKEKILIIRIPEKLKREFKMVCNSKNLTMSQVLNMEIQNFLNKKNNELIQTQLQIANPIDEDMLTYLKTPKYHNNKLVERRDIYKSGRKIKIGDKVLFGLLNEELIKFHIEEINTLYEFAENDNDTLINLKFKDE